MKTAEQWAEIAFGRTKEHGAFFTAVEGTIIEAMDQARAEGFKAANDNAAEVIRQLRRGLESFSSIQERCAALQAGNKWLDEYNAGALKDSGGAR